MLLTGPCIAVADQVPIEDLGPATRPAVEDRASAMELFDLLGQADEDAKAGVEVANNARLPWVMPGLIALRDGTELRQKQLDRARGALGWLRQGLIDAKSITQPERLLIPRVRSRIAIDGKLSEDWNGPHAEVAIEFDHVKKVAPASVRLAHDDEFLYGLVMVPDASIVAPVLERDGEIYNSDCVEVFLYDPGTRDYWELNFSPSGVVRDTYNTKDLKSWGGTFRPDRNMDGLKWAHAANGKVNDASDVDQGYGIEFAIPIKNLPRTAGQDLRLFVARVDRNATGEGSLVAHVPWVGWFHNVWCYQPIEFE